MSSEKDEAVSGLEKQLQEQKAKTELVQEKVCTTDRLICLRLERIIVNPA